MNRLLASLVVTAAVTMLPLAGCGTAVHGTSCTVLQQDDGDALITCTDGTSALVSGADNQGQALGCTVEEVDGAKLLSCDDGTEAWIHDGLDGLAGAPGQAGVGCTVEDLGDGTKLISCEDGTEVYVTDGVDGADGKDGKDGKDGEDGEDGEDAVYDPLDVVDPVLQGDLSEEDEERIDTLRDSIDQGLGIGEVKYIENISLALQELGVVDDYESMVDTEDFSTASLVPESCPFVKHYDNGFQPSGFACDYLADLAKVEVYAELAEILDDQPLPNEISESEWAEEADFWYEQGAISGIEKQRVLVRTDLHTQLVCNVSPTPYESSYDKGLIVGGQAMVNAFNTWLASNGHVADYPTMSQPIQVCNMNESMLDPAHQAAVQNVPLTHTEHPLCDDYDPPTQQQAVEYAQADISYTQGIIAGVHAEHAVAAVRIFHVVPCNVGDPLVVDLDGDGLELTPVHQGVNFDFYGVGQAQAVAWVGPDDALLVQDRNGNGAIDDGYELFGNIDQAHADGFAHLATLDANGDGMVSADDPAFAELLLWQDRDTDGVSTPEELRPLTELGILAIPVKGAALSMRSGGTRIPVAAEALTARGTMLVGDAMFTTAPFSSPRLAR